MSDLIVSAIKKEMIPVMWPLVEEHLQRAIDQSNGELDKDDVFSRMVRGNMLLITLSRQTDIVAALALEQRDFDSGKKVLNITLAGGSESDNWIDKMDEVTQQLGKDYGCDEIYIVGRAGWVRKLKRIGYGIVHTVVSKKVGE